MLPLVLGSAQLFALAKTRLGTWEVRVVSRGFFCLLRQRFKNFCQKMSKNKNRFENWERARPGLVKVKVCGGEIWSGLGSRLGQKEVGRLGYDLENGKIYEFLRTRNLTLMIHLLKVPNGSDHFVPIVEHHVVFGCSRDPIVMLTDLAQYLNF